MQTMSKRERVDAALRGADVDRVPVSAWQHFIPAESSPETLSRASLDHFHGYDWDWIKVNPRATYYAEAWGNRYDYSRYKGVFPALEYSRLQQPAGLEGVGEVSGTSGVFDEQLKLIRLIGAGIGGAHFIQTVFSPLSVLYFLSARPEWMSLTLLQQEELQYAELKRMMRQHPSAVHAALANITHTLAQFARAVVDAGASGLFFAITRLAREGVLSVPEFEEFGKPYDIEVLNAVQSAPFNMLHTCGPQVYMGIVADYPAHAINWASVGQQNPAMPQAAKLTSMALVGGVDEVHTLQNGTPAEIIAQARMALAQTGARHHLLSPGCATSMDVPAENLQALRAAAQMGAY